MTPSVTAGQQYVLDLTSLTLTAVQWPGHPPLAVLPTGEQIVQILSWVPALNRWLRLGSQGRRLDGSTVDLTFGELNYLAQTKAAGASIDQAMSMLFAR